MYCPSVAYVTSPCPALTTLTVVVGGNVAEILFYFGPIGYKLC